MFLTRNLVSQHLLRPTCPTRRPAKRHLGAACSPRLCPCVCPEARYFSAGSSKMAIAAIGQICSTPDLSHNLDQCLKLIKEAAQAGAKAIFFPEASDYIASSPQESLSLARPESESPFVLGLQAAAKEHGIHISAGVHVPSAEPTSTPPAGADLDTTTTTTKLLNRTIWVLPTGEVDGSRGYDKLHLFDYGSLRESAHTRAGDRLVPPFDTPVGRVGSLICFDLRFPEAATALAQPRRGSGQGGHGHGHGQKQDWLPAQVLTYPSAFTVPTGAAHWETLLRARAIEV
ncbi:hypothetical protein KVR01_009916 [Diaporthe batatas]|uniref:uncharacterized protein n=1 Tax=Diaporthe batatas TaxID=748121 RepID=UPI001D03A0AE|nr:uncharacterized protein KVR01_009916 [Diaporthe batatas]KAG8160380.1 hypothetical protein KVR01_009916 [Diaporthe batatas]